MNKLMKMLAQGEMPNFAQMLAALNDISDVDWDRVESLQLPIRDVFKSRCMAKYPQIQPGEFCESCG